MLLLYNSNSYHIIVHTIINNYIIMKGMLCTVRIKDEIFQGFLHSFSYKHNMARLLFVSLVFSVAVVKYLFKFDKTLIIVSNIIIFIDLFRHTV
jgi:hypothetical protein